MDDPQVIAALAKAVDELARLRVRPDATQGSVQREVRAGEAIPIHGGDEEQGIFNGIDVAPRRPGWAGPRWRPARAG